MKAKRTRRTTRDPAQAFVGALRARAIGWVEAACTRDGIEASTAFGQGRQAGYAEALRACAKEIDAVIAEMKGKAAP